MTKSKERKCCFVKEKVSKNERFKQQSLKIFSFEFLIDKVCITKKKPKLNVLNDYSYNYKRLLRSLNLHFKYIISTPALLLIKTYISLYVVDYR